MVAKPNLRIMETLHGKQFTVECIKGDRRGQQWVFRTGTVIEHHSQGYHRLRIDLKKVDLIEGQAEECTLFMASVEYTKFTTMEDAMDDFLRNRQMRVTVATYPKQTVNTFGPHEQFVCRFMDAQTPEVI